MSKKLNKQEIKELELQIAKDNGLTLKKIKFFIGHDKMTGLSCDLYMNGKKIAYCYDDARGGEMEIDPYTEIHRKTLIDLEGTLKMLPEYQCTEYDFSLKHSIEHIVNELANDYAEQKDLQKDFRKGIVYKNKKGEIYIRGWAHALPMYIAMKKESAIANIKRVLQELEEEGYTVMNREYIATLGVAI